MKQINYHIKITVAYRQRYPSKTSTFAVIAVNDSGDIIYRLLKNGKWYKSWNNNLAIMTYDNLIRHFRKHCGRVRFRNTEYTNHILSIIRREKL